MHSKRFVTLKIATLLLAGLLSLQGCVVQSVKPFYTDSVAIEAPAALLGSWKLVREGGKEVKSGQSPWKIDAHEVNASDEKNVQSQLVYQLFTINGQMYVDSQPKEIPSDHRPGDLWMWHITPMHLLSRVELEGDHLKIIPFDSDWLKKQVNSGLQSVTDQKLDMKVYTASSEQWQAFLQKVPKNEKAFNIDAAFEFIRLK